MGREELLNRMRAASPRSSFIDNTFDRLLRELLSALDPFDRVTFEKRLNGAVAVVPFEEALHGILLPLQEQVGQLWHDGHVNSGPTEHYVTKHIQQKIFSAMNQLPVAEFGVKVVVACPPGEEHDIAALAVAYRCRVRGCRVYYLGANVPVTDLTKLCHEVEPDLTSCRFHSTLPENTVTEVIEALAHDVSTASTLIAGGNGAIAMHDRFMQSHIEVLKDFGELDEKLDQLDEKIYHSRVMKGPALRGCVSAYVFYEWNLPNLFPSPCTHEGPTVLRGRRRFSPKPTGDEALRQLSVGRLSRDAGGSDIVPSRPFGVYSQLDDLAMEAARCARVSHASFSGCPL